VLAVLFCCNAGPALYTQHHGHVLLTAVPRSPEASCCSYVVLAIAAAYGRCGSPAWCTPACTALPMGPLMGGMPATLVPCMQLACGPGCGGVVPCTLPLHVPLPFTDWMVAGDHGWAGQSPWFKQLMQHRCRQWSVLSVVGAVGRGASL
jgi:hypothetical protein